jgi:hypothetical protein
VTQSELQLRQLIRRWRSHAQMTNDVPCSLPWVHGVRLGERNCADELEAALSVREAEGIGPQEEEEKET